MHGHNNGASLTNDIISSSLKDNNGLQGQTVAADESDSYHRLSNIGYWSFAVAKLLITDKPIYETASPLLQRDKKNVFA